MERRSLSRWVVAVFLFLAATPAWAADFATAVVSASSAHPWFPTSSLKDNDINTSWSSAVHSGPSNHESIAFWWAGGMQATNYVKLRPRYHNGVSLGFPRAFNVYYSNGSSWVMVLSVTDYPAQHRDWVVIPLPGDYQADGIHIIATNLGTDNVGNYVFQLAEAKAGYDPAFAQFRYRGNERAIVGNKMQIAGTRANAFNPNKLKTWNFDERGEVISPRPGYYRNIYSPQAVHLGGDVYRIYFHGYDGVSLGDAYDRIYTTVTWDNFWSFEPHFLQIDHGQCLNVGNESVVWVGPNDWRMFYTCGGSAQYPGDRTGYATSTNGTSWTPSQGSMSHFVQVTGYPDWQNGQFNGVNPIIRDAAGVWHYYFMDSRYNNGVEHATGTDGVNFTFRNKAQIWGTALNDIKPFQYNGQTHYAACYHTNNNLMWVSTTTNLSALNDPVVAFTSNGSADATMATCGWVQDGTRILGMLYGGGPPSTNNQFRIFARWLQKRVVFTNAYGTWDVNTGYTPSNSRLALTSIETGRFKVYDTDGTTLLYTSPEVTVRPGDMWSYAGP